MLSRRIYTLQIGYSIAAQLTPLQLLLVFQHLPCFNLDQICTCGRRAPSTNIEHVAARGFSRLIPRAPPHYYVVKPCSSTGGTGTSYVRRIDSLLSSWALTTERRRPLIWQSSRARSLSSLRGYRSRKSICSQSQMNVGHQ